ncbi:MAG: hypothetical protein IRZ24_04670 [Thermogemmatispora sp.]|nr:hypothetical protein [Thermogemmatispora sp.]
MHQLRFAASGLEIIPNPPRAGEVVTIRLCLCNEGAQPLTVRKITPWIYSFGIGACDHECLPEKGPLTLSVDPTHVETLTWQWLPRSGGHRCLRVSLDIENVPRPWIIGCNLQVIEAAADAYRWQVPFHLANPTEQLQPLRLGLQTQSMGLRETARQVWIELPARGRGSAILSPGQTLWLQPHEQRAALLVVRIHRFAIGAFELVNDVKAWLGDQFLDGIRVIVRRRTPVALPATPGEGQATSLCLANLSVGSRS